MASSTIFTVTPTIYLRRPLLELGATRLLDIGCGSGGYVLDLAAHGVSGLGIDIGSVPLDLAAHKLSNIGLSREDFIESVISRAKEIDPDADELITFLFGINSHIGDICGKCWGDAPEHEMYIGNKLKAEASFSRRDALSDLSDIVADVDAITLLNVIHTPESYLKAHDMLENVLAHTPLNCNLALAYCSSNLNSVSNAEYDLENKRVVIARGSVEFHLGKALEKMGFEYKENLSRQLWEQTNRYMQIFEGYRQPPSDKINMLYNKTEEDDADYRASYFCMPPTDFSIQYYIGKRLEISSLSLKEAIESVL